MVFHLEIRPKELFDRPTIILTKASSRTILISVHNPVGPPCIYYQTVPPKHPASEIKTSSSSSAHSSLASQKQEASFCSQGFLPSSFMCDKTHFAPKSHLISVAKFETPFFVFSPLMNILRLGRRLRLANYV